MFDLRITLRKYFYIFFVFPALVGSFIAYGMKSSTTIPRNDIMTKQQMTLPSSFSPNQDGWKNYTDSNYKFKVMYPEKWQLSTNNYKYDTNIVSIYKDSLSGPRIELYKDFQGGFCDGYKSEDIQLVSIEIPNGITAKKTECSSAIGINFEKDGANLWLIAYYVNDDNRNIFYRIINSLKFDK